MKEKLAQVKSTIDKREGSLIHFACGANSAEAAQMYITLEWMFRQMFGDTADREYLAKIAYDTRGLIPEAATHAVLKGKFNIEVKSGKGRRACALRCDRIGLFRAINSPDR